MKGRESGMPEEPFWQTFFDPDAALGLLILDLPSGGNIVEFGCGYGTFTLPAARRTHGLVSALDMDPEMVASVAQKAEDRRLTNVRATVRDFVADGTGLPSQTQSHAMIFNLLHIENPVALLEEAHRVLSLEGKLSVIHWRSDIPTPRGPSLAIRPTPGQCAQWIKEAGFADIRPVDLKSCCPYHYGLVAAR